MTPAATPATGEPDHPEAPVIPKPTPTESGTTTPGAPVTAESATTGRIRPGGGHGAGRRGDDHLKRLRRATVGLIAVGHSVGKFCRERLLEGGGCHAGGLEDVLVEVVLEFLAADLLDDVPGQRHAVIRISGSGSRSENLLRGLLRDIDIEVELVPGSVCLLESCGVGEKMPQRDVPREPPIDLHINVGADIGVEIEFSLLDELHHRNRRGNLRNRARAEQGPLRIHRLRLSTISAGIGIAVSPIRHHLTVVNDRHDRPRNLPIVQGCRDLAVQPGIHVRLGQIVLPLGGRHTGTRSCRSPGTARPHEHRRGDEKPCRHTSQHSHCRSF